MPLDSLERELRFCTTTSVLNHLLNVAHSLALEEASTFLEKQEQGRQEADLKVIKDLEGIKENIDQVWQRVGKWNCPRSNLDAWGLTDPSPLLNANFCVFSVTIQSLHSSLYLRLPLQRLYSSLLTCIITVM